MQRLIPRSLDSVELSSFDARTGRVCATISQTLEYAAHRKGLSHRPAKRDRRQVQANLRAVRLATDVMNAFAAQFREDGGRCTVRTRWERSSPERRLAYPTVIIDRRRRSSSSASGATRPDKIARALTERTGRLSLPGLPGLCRRSHVMQNWSG